MAKEIGNIGDLMSLDDVLPPIHKPKEFYGITLVMSDAELLEGGKGDYYRMKVTVEQTKTEVFITSGAMQIKAVIAAWFELGKPPFRFTFVKSGDMDWIVNPADY